MDERREEEMRIACLKKFGCEPEEVAKNFPYAEWCDFIAEQDLDENDTGLYSLTHQELDEKLYLKLKELWVEKDTETLVADFEGIMNRANEEPSYIDTELDFDDGEDVVPTMQVDEEEDDDTALKRRRKNTEYVPNMLLDEMITQLMLERNIPNDEKDDEKDDESIFFTMDFDEEDAEYQMNEYFMEEIKEDQNISGRNKDNEKDEKDEVIFSHKSRIFFSLCICIPNQTNFFYYTEGK